LYCGSSGIPVEEAKCGGRFGIQWCINSKKGVVKKIFTTPFLLVKLLTARDADPGSQLRRRRREVALVHNITNNALAILDARPTLTLRFPYE
jgi:hypothetical protein